MVLYVYTIYHVGKTNFHKRLMLLDILLDFLW